MQGKAIMDKTDTKRAYKNRVRAEVRLYLQDYKAARPCSCGENRHYCLVFHHSDMTTKCFSLSHSRDKSFKDIVKEVAKCKVMCANCHQAVHYFNTAITRERWAADVWTDDDLLLFEYL